jgi:hypothetical protein
MKITHHEACATRADEKAYNIAKQRAKKYTKRIENLDGKCKKLAGKYKIKLDLLAVICESYYHRRPWERVLWQLNNKSDH